ncbi:MAG: LysM peptidoglycan-binding domain-containing protein [Gammaproteobacteria bacterium]|nr:LysM peptidoglycan-binding domain-containing protein [Gammaproteobacteria bacterium]
MLNKICITASLILLTLSPLQADEIKLNADQPDSYVVQEGDTLWDISSKFLQEPWRWPEIWQVNPQIADPHLIYPGDQISLSYQDGSPVLTVNRDGSRSSMSRRSGRNVKLSPGIRSSENADAIPTIPIDVIEQFLVRPLVVSDTEMDDWPYIVSTYDNHLIAANGNRVYVRGLSGSARSERFSIYRKGPAYQSGSEGNLETIGYEALHVADAIIERTGDPATAVIVNSTREVLAGDRLVAQSTTDVSTDFIPRSPDNSINGSIISVIDGVSEIGQYQVVVLDVGESDGIENGNVVGVFQSGAIISDRVNVTSDWRVREKGKGVFDGEAFKDYLGRKQAAGEDVQLPEEYAAVVMVFRTFGRISYGLVMEATAPIHLNDMVRNL